MAGQNPGPEPDVSLPTSTTWIATGNNIVVAGDLATRVLSSRIDPHCENPGERKFKIEDLRSYALQHRGELICAALTCLRSYVAAGRPRQNIKPFGRFEQWSDLVRSALVWLGCEDPCLSRKSLMTDDPVNAGLAEVLATWHAAYGSEPKTAAEVVAVCWAVPVTNRPLADALRGVLPHGEAAAKPLGQWLRRYKDRLVNGMAIRRGPEDRQHTATWIVVKVEAAGT